MPCMQGNSFRRDTLEDLDYKMCVKSYCSWCPPGCPEEKKEFQMGRKFASFEACESCLDKRSIVFPQSTWRQGGTARKTCKAYEPMPALPDYAPCLGEWNPATDEKHFVRCARSYCSWKEESEPLSQTRYQPGREYLNWEMCERCMTKKCSHALNRGEQTIWCPGGSGRAGCARRDAVDPGIGAVGP